MDQPGKLAIERLLATLEVIFEMLDAHPEMEHQIAGVIGPNNLRRLRDRSVAASKVWEAESRHEVLSDLSSDEP